MDIRKVRKLIEMLEESGLEEIEIKEGEESVRLLKKHTNTIVSEIISTDKEASNTPSHESSANQDNTKNDTSVAGEIITSPMVGTFYASASPGAKPFVAEGDQIKEGDVVCIVEAMKMMNEIKSDFSGKVIEVLVENSEPVEFGQILFRIG